MRNMKLLQKMTVEEKAALLSGKGEWQTWPIPRLSIPSMHCSDGPHGVRKQANKGDHLGLNESLKATCFPTAATLANSWDEQLCEQVATALGEEAMAQDVQVLLGPGVNMKRSPLCGRNFEYFSEDPYLTGKMAAAYIRGVQSQGVYSCVKHFAVNSQEERRMSMDAIVDERTLREIYLTAFEIALKEGHAKALMSSYNKVNGSYANENPHLLMDILRQEWGYDGIVITDWGGSNDHVRGVKCRSDLEMPAPGLDSARQILQALEDGELSMNELNQCVDELLTAILETAKAKKDAKQGFDVQAHHKIAERAAKESIVLLKNEDQILPLDTRRKVAIIGDFAITPRYQGAGSSLVNPTREQDFVTVAREEGVLEILGIEQGYRRNGKSNPKLEATAQELAKQADIVLFFFGLDESSESEGMDRRHMRLPENQIHLLELLAKENDNIVGVLSGGAPIEMPWEDQLKGSLHGYLSGQAGARAMHEILIGRQCPSGKLAETYPMRYEDTPAKNYYPAAQKTSEYREGIYIGYRYYDKAGVEVRYPFGYGLSYTTFAYSDLTVEKDKISLFVENTGDRAGAEIVQMYVSLSDSKVFRPKKELKGFQKVFLEPHEKKIVQIPFDERTFRFWNVQEDSWCVEEGAYEILVGSDSRTIHLRQSLQVKGNVKQYPVDQESLMAYQTGKIQKVGTEEYEKLLGHKVGDDRWKQIIEVNDAICQMEYAKSRLARGIFHILDWKMQQAEKRGVPDLNVLFIYNMPFRALAKMTAGQVSREMTDGMVQVVNGHFFRGMKKIIGGYFRNKRANRAYVRCLDQGKCEE